MRGPMPAPRRRSPACGLAGVGRSVGRRRGLRSRPVGPGLAALRGAAARAAAVSGPRPPSPGRPGPLGLSARGPRPSRRGVQPPRGRRCGVGGPGPRRPWLAGASVPGPVGRGGRCPGSWSASWGGGPVSLPPSAAPCPSRPGSPLAAPYRAARQRHGRPPLLPPRGAGAAACGRPGQSPRPGGVGLVLGLAWVLLRPWWALPPCCVAAGG